MKTWSNEGLAANSTWTFTTGAGAAPQVTAKAPADDAADVPIGSSVTATFSRSIDPATLTSQTFSLTGAGGAAVPASISYDSPTRTAVLTPTARWRRARSHTATITTGVRAPDGTALSAPVTWSFTTGAAVQITARSPAPLATDVSPSAVGPRDLLEGARPGHGQRHDRLPRRRRAARRCRRASATTRRRRTAILTPNGTLGLATTYTAHVTLGVHGADGSPLDAPSDWTFTTGLTAPAGPTLVEP